MKTSIALIGFMGAGKTAVGMALADKLGKEFIELDLLIERIAGKAIPGIFSQDGEIRFREIEIEATKEVTCRKNAVIACGGGIVVNAINIDRLRNECIIVYLTASPGVILRRTSGDNKIRPMLKDTDKRQRIQELLIYRKPFYERAADIKVNTSGFSIKAVAEQIIEELKANESFH